MALIKFNKQKLDKGTAIRTASIFFMVTVYVFSAYSTFNVAFLTFKSMATAVCISFLVESGKFLFDFYFFHKKKETFNIWEWAYLGMWLVFVSVSVFFSASSIDTDLKERQYDNKINSVEYKQTQDKINSINKQITDTQDSIKKLEGSKINTADIVSQQNETDKTKKDLLKQLQNTDNAILTKQKELTGTNSKLARVRTDIQKEIKALQVSKAGIETQLKGITGNDNTTANAKIDEQIKELYTKIDKLREAEEKTEAGEKKESKNSFQELLEKIKISELWFWVFFSIVLEVAGHIMVRELRERKVKAPVTPEPEQQMSTPTPEQQAPTPTPQKPEQQIPQEPESAPQRQIGFVTAKKEKKEAENFDGDRVLGTNEYKKYVNYMYDNAKNNISTGYNTIAKNIGIPVETARKIKAHLEQSGIVQVVGSKTIILKQKEKNNY